MRFINSLPVFAAALVAVARAQPTITPDLFGTVIHCQTEHLYCQGVAVEIKPWWNSARDQLTDRLQLWIAKDDSGDYQFRFEVVQTQAVGVPVAPGKIGDLEELKKWGTIMVPAKDSAQSAADKVKKLIKPASRPTTSSRKTA